MAIAGLVSRNAVPVAGLLFLGWSAVNLIVLYFFDFVLDIAFVLALLMLLHPDFRKEVRQVPVSAGALGKVKMAVGLLLGFAVLLATFALVFGVPVFGMLFTQADRSLASLFGDDRFRKGVAIHLVLSSWTYCQAYRYFSRALASEGGFDVGAPLKGRFNFVLVRWLAVYAAGLFIPFYPAIMVVAYCVATVYIELFPRKVEEFLGPEEKEARPR